MRFAPHMYLVLFALCPLLGAPAGCSKTTPLAPSQATAAQKTSTPLDAQLPQNTSRDHLVGWYKLGDTLIPVFKIDGTYYSACRGFEFPLKECPEGLELAITPSSMADTKIGFAVASKEYYISIVDDLLSGNSDGRYGIGEKRPMTKIHKPSGLLDATAPPPRTNDDFLGWYQPVWFPFAFEVRKEDERYLCVENLPDESGVWKTVSEREITPLPDRLGFSGFDRHPRKELTYNDALKRFEITSQLGKREPSIIRMPLARTAQPPEVPAISPPMIIGIPSWH